MKAFVLLMHSVGYKCRIKRERAVSSVVFVEPEILLTSLHRITLSRFQDEENSARQVVHAAFRMTLIVFNLLYKHGLY